MSANLVSRFEKQILLCQPEYQDPTCEQSHGDGNFNNVRHIAAA